MKPAETAPPRSVLLGRASTRHRLKWLVAAIGVLAWLALSPPSRNDLVGGDEGYYGTMARNVLADPSQVLSVPRAPLGPPGDKPPAYPAILAAFVRAMGPTEAAVRLPSLLMAFVILLATATLVARAVGPPWGLVTVLILVCLPWFADTSRWAAGEIPVTAFCLAGLVLLTTEQLGTLRAFVAGALLGLGFLCKLWFAALFLLPALLFLWSPRPTRWAAMAALLAGFAAVGSLQLLGLLLLRPQELSHWLDIYLGFSLATRLAGEGYADYWTQPPGYYWFSITHAFVLLLPLVALGFEYTVRRLHEPFARLFLAWGLLILPLSVFSVKSWIYLYPVVPAWGALAALGAASLARGTHRAGVVTALFFLFSSPPVARLAGSDPPPLAVWAVVWGAFGAVLWFGRRRAPWLSRAAVGILVLAIAGGAHRVTQRLPLPYHDVGYSEVAAALAPYLQASPPAQVSYLAPEAPAFAYYLFRTGRYWATQSEPWSAARFRDVRADTAIRAFVIDPTTRHPSGWPGEEAVAWLEASTREITQEIEDEAGRPIPLRVFVRAH